MKQSKLDETLLDLGYPAHLSGTEYIRTACRVYRPGQSITRELYPAIAAAHDTTPNRVERAIRHATEIAFCRCDYQTQLRYFGASISPDKGKPTNAELIARLERLTRED